MPVGPERQKWYWLCDIEENRLRAVLTSANSEQLLRQLGISSVTEEEYMDLLVSLVGKVNDIYDNLPVQEPEKKPLARKLLERIHLVTHREMECAEAVELVTSELADRRDAARAAAWAEKRARFSAYFEEYERARALT